MLVRDLEPAKRRRLRKAAEVRKGATPTAAEEEATRPEAEEATGPVADEPQHEATAPPPSVEEHLEAEERAPTPPRPATPPERQEVDAEATRRDSPVTGNADAGMEEGAPPPPPPSTEAEGETASSEATAGATAEDTTLTGQAPLAPEVHEEAPPEKIGRAHV